MKKIILSYILIISLLSGCASNIVQDEKQSKGIEGDLLQLKFFQVSKVSIKDLDPNNIGEIINEKKINDNTYVFLFKKKDNNQISAGMKSKGEYFFIGEVSMDNTPMDLIGIEQVQVFGEKSIKIYGVLGVNYAQSFYWNLERSLENSVIQVEGNAKEIDLDGDGKKEIISTSDTIPETKIYKLEENKILASNINKSIGAKSVIMSDMDRKLFDVYFEPNKLEQYSYYKGVLKKEY